MPKLQGNPSRDHQTPWAARFCDKIYLDVWGPSPIQTPGHKSYYVSFTDNHTRWTHLQLLATKDSIFQAYKEFEAWAKLHHQIPAFKTFHSDRGGEYLGAEFSKYLHSQGTIWRLTIHNTPKYNGVSKCLNWTLHEHTHALLHSSKLPKNLWGEAINHVTWFKNRTLTCTLPEGKTPYEMLNQTWGNCKNGEIKLDTYPQWYKIGWWYDMIMQRHGFAHFVS